MLVMPAGRGAGDKVAGGKVAAALGVAVEAASVGVVAVGRGVGGVGEGEMGVFVGKETAVSVGAGVVVGRAVVQPRRVSQKTAVNRLRIRRKRIETVCLRKETLA